ncbi:hypothetical protein Ahy_A05g025606 [Arachis hypogaea]|uniref:Uncharacterized protein n=1 Tax=Arachis hypogaea TaxID=3818 RepID=A0A445D943_ARAHY|nr:hypothetical protein Ahy_A05g025606 [Arachis hypogaea]
MVEGFGVENNNWILDILLLGAKYVNSKYNLVEFIQHFNQSVDHIQWKEVQADLASVNENPVCKHRGVLPMFTTLSILYMFKPILVRVASMKVINMRQTGSYVIYFIGLDIEMEFNFSCMRMESFGIPYSARDYGQVNASGAGLGTNDMGHGNTKGPKNIKHRCGQYGMEGYNQINCHLEDRGIDIFEITWMIRYMMRMLEDFWESVKEWSAYGAGVPLMLNGSESMMKYYNVSLSAIQFYIDLSKPSSRLSGGLYF